MQEIKCNYIMIATDVDDVAFMYSGVNNQSSQLFLLNHKLYEKNLYKIIARFLYARKLSFIFTKKIQFAIKHILQKVYKKFFFNHFEKKIKLDASKISVEKKYCFIVMARVFEEYGDSLIEYLKKKFPDALYTTYFVDVVESFKTPISAYYSSFDKIYSFDKSECKKYNFIYCLEPFTYHQIESINKSPEYDVTFIGAAKDRLDDILSVYEKLKAHNLRLDFWIFGVKDENQKYKEEIHYNSYLSFDDFIKHSLNARCTFEALQKNGSSPTTRFSMCMLYKRKLLTNCTELLDSEWSDAMATGNIQVYKDMETIDFKWIKKDCEYDNQKFIERFSTDRMIETIDSTL